jgi:hypothetical protein
MAGRNNYHFVTAAELGYVDFSRINDGCAHRGAHRRVNVDTAIECSDFSEFGMTAFLSFFDTPLANPPPR